MVWLILEIYYRDMCEGYIVGIYCRDMSQGYVVGIRCGDMLVAYVVGIRCGDMLQAYVAGIRWLHRIPQVYVGYIGRGCTAVRVVSVGVVYLVVCRWGWVVSRA